MILDLLLSLPTSRRGWGWTLVILGPIGAALAVAAGPLVAAVSLVTGGLVALILGICALNDRKNGGWWALIGIILLAAAVVSFALLRSAV